MVSTCHLGSTASGYILSLMTAAISWTVRTKKYLVMRVLYDSKCRFPISVPSVSTAWLYYFWSTVTISFTIRTDLGKWQNEFSSAVFSNFSVLFREFSRHLRYPLKQFPPYRQTKTSCPCDSKVLGILYSCCSKFQLVVINRDGKLSGLKP
jgi:hypothetical protein